MGIKILGAGPRTGGVAPTTVIETFLATDARFFGELGVPDDQLGWTDAATAPATITIVEQEVFGVTRDVVKHFDDGAQSTLTSFALTAQNWLDINAFGATYGGTSRLDTLDGEDGFFTGLQTNAAENPLGTGTRRYQVFFEKSGIFLGLTPIGFATSVMDGTGGHPRILFDEWFKWEFVVPPGLGNAKVFIKGVETPIVLNFAVNAGGQGTLVTVQSGSSGGVNRVAYHSDFGVTIYEDSATKTLSAAAMQSTIAKIAIPPGRRDYTIIVPNGSPRSVGDILSFTQRNVGGIVTLKAQDIANPEALFFGLNEATRRVFSAGDVTLVNSLEGGNVYDFGVPSAQPDKIISAFVSTADVTVANTVAETSLVGLGNGSLTVPANSTKIGDRFAFSVQGILSSGANPTLRLQLKSGAVVLADTGAQVIGNLADGHWIITGDVVTRTIGATGTATISGSFVTSAGDHFEFVNTVPVTVDTTINRVVDVTAIWGTAAVGNTITAQIAHLTKFASP